MPNLIDFPAGFETQIFATASQLFNDFAPFIIMIGGVLVGMLVIGFIINLLK